MLASKFITSAIAALTIVGTVGMVVAQTSPSDAATTTAPAESSVQSAPVETTPSLPATSSAPADSPMTTEAEPAVQPDRN